MSIAEYRGSYKWAGLLIVVLIAACAWAFWMTLQNWAMRRDAQRQVETLTLEWFGFGPPVTNKLNPRFVDVDGDLVADVPATTDQLASPDKLYFSYIAGADASAQTDWWRAFGSYIADSVGVPVEIVSFPHIRDQLEAMRKGELHVMGLNTGAVPLAVNTCGFVPFCTLGREDGTFGSTMQMIVPAGSPIQKIRDLKGRRLVFTDRNSNSGYKAAVVLLRDFELLPQRDYRWEFSGGHMESIQGIAKGRYQAASVSSEMLQRAVATGEVDGPSLRVVFESERFAPATFGYAFNLSPEIADGVRTAFFGFDWSGSDLEREFGTSGMNKFVPVSYKDDFALIRRIDDALGSSAAPLPQ